MGPEGQALMRINFKSTLTQWDVIIKKLWS